jgi:hypothetical protein
MQSHKGGKFFRFVPMCLWTFAPFFVALCLCVSVPLYLYHGAKTKLKSSPEGENFFPFPEGDNRFFEAKEINHG